MNLVRRAKRMSDDYNHREQRSTPHSQIYATSSATQSDYVTYSITDAIQAGWYAIGHTECLLSSRNVFYPPLKASLKVSMKRKLFSLLWHISEHGSLFTPQNKSLKKAIASLHFSILTFFRIAWYEHNCKLWIQYWET